MGYYIMEDKKRYSLQVHPKDGTKPQHYGTNHQSRLLDMYRELRRQFPEDSVKVFDGERDITEHFESAK